MSDVTNYWKMVVQPEVVSEGTLRTEDLFPTFIDALEALEGETLRVKSLREEYEAACDPGVKDEILYEDLFDALEEHAGTGLYFGSHPGDGACFGFFPVEESQCPA